MDLPTVPVDPCPPPAVLLGKRLSGDEAAGPVVEVELLALVDQRLDGVAHAGPAVKEARRVLAERYDVAERGEHGGFLEEDDAVALAVAFDGRGEACEAGADDED